MYIVSVTPFSKGFKADSLSYFSSKEITPGNIVSVPLRKSTVKGLVTKCEDGKNFKQELKEASYGIKKIKGVSKNPLFNEAFIEATKETADYFATSSGSIIKSLVPKAVLDDSPKFQYKKDNVDKIQKSDKTAEKYIIQTPDAERYSDYKSLVRTMFAKNKSVFFCVPTIEDTVYAESLLSKGIEKNTFIFNSKTTKKQLEKKWNEVVESKKPVLVIGTGAFLSIPRNDYGIIIVERENSGAYKTFSRPFFDIRRFAEIYASKSGAAFLLGDLLLRAETLWRYDENELIERTPIKFRFLNTANSRSIDMKNEAKEENGKKKEYPILSEQLQDLLTKAHTDSKQTLLLTSRKGLSPIIVCGDCAHTVTCEDCSAPVVLYEGKNKNSSKDNYFKCHHCGNSRDAMEGCKKCGSWKLNMLGCGIDKVAEKVSGIIPEENVYVLDKEKASTHKKARDIIEKFSEDPAGVLIGTEMVLLYLKKEVENVGIVTIDSMFSVPDFQINERILNILLRARSKAMDNFFVQSRNIDNPIFDEAIKGNLADFYRQEFVDRKKFNYPPFTTLIKISGAAKTRKKIENDFEGLKHFLRPYELKSYSAFTEVVRGQHRMHGLIRLPRNNWPDKILSDKLKELPHQFKVEIDAQSII
jgi:primosomal protein N' (replication factor Y)